MSTDKNYIEKQIVKSIREVGHEQDMKDIKILRRFCEQSKKDNYDLAVSCSCKKSILTNKKSNNKFSKIIISFSSIAALLALFFSLNIYFDYQQMDKAFTNYYYPLEYDSELSSRGAETLSLELSIAMEAYKLKKYTEVLQRFNTINIDREYLIYKAICFIEIEKLPEAITLLEDLIKDGEGTPYYQDANWYLANIYLKNHEKKKALEILLKIEQSNNIYAEKAKGLIKILK